MEGMGEVESEGFAGIGGGEVRSKGREEEVGRRVLCADAGAALKTIAVAAAVVVDLAIVAAARMHHASSLSSSSGFFCHCLPNFPLN